MISQVKDAKSKRYVGEIVKEWSERIRNIYTRSQWVRTMNFNVLFPVDLPAEHKAIILSMSFLLVSGLHGDIRRELALFDGAMIQKKAV